MSFYPLFLAGEFAFRIPVIASSAFLFFVNLDSSN